MNGQAKNDCPHPEPFRRTIMLPTGVTIVLCGGCGREITGFADNTPCPQKGGMMGKVREAVDDWARMMAYPRPDQHYTRDEMDAICRRLDVAVDEADRRDAEHAALVAAVKQCIDETETCAEFLARAKLVTPAKRIADIAEMLRDALPKEDR